MERSLCASSFMPQMTSNFVFFLSYFSQTSDDFHGHLRLCLYPEICLSELPASNPSWTTIRSSWKATVEAWKRLASGQEPQDMTLRCQVLHKLRGSHFNGRSKKTNQGFGFNTNKTHLGLIWAVNLLPPPKKNI